MAPSPFQNSAFTISYSLPTRATHAFHDLACFHLPSRVYAGVSYVSGVFAAMLPSQLRGTCPIPVKINALYAVPPTFLAETITKCARHSTQPTRFVQPSHSKTPSSLFVISTSAGANRKICANKSRQKNYFVENIPFFFAFSSQSFFIS